MNLKGTSQWTSPLTAHRGMAADDVRCAVAAGIPPAVEPACPARLTSGVAVPCCSLNRRLGGGVAAVRAAGCTPSTSGGTPDATRQARAFTLIELILGIAIMAMVLIAMNSVFFTAMRLRERTLESLENAMPVEHALAVIRRDLQGMVAPSADAYVLGHFRAGGVSSLGMSMPVEIEFCTTTGVMREDQPWGEVQKVTYGLRPGADRSMPGQDLIRGVTRNLLATVMPQPEEQWMMSGVESVEFAGYDGIQWRTMWDTELTDTNLPTAMRVRILLANRQGSGQARPIEMLVPIGTQVLTNVTSAEMETY